MKNRFYRTAICLILIFFHLTCICKANLSSINHDTSHIESWSTLKKHNYSLYSPVPSEKNLTEMYRVKKDISDTYRDIRRGDGAEATEIISGELGGYFGERNSGLKQALAEDFEDAYYEDIKLGRDKKLSVTSTKKALWNLTDSLYKLEVENGGIEYEGSYFSYHIPYDTEDASIVAGIRAGTGLYKLSSYALRKLAKDSLKDAESGVVTLVKERAATSTPAPGGMEPDDDEGKGKKRHKINLDEHEGAQGHAIDRHINVNDDELKERLIKQFRKISGSSKFYDKKTAENAIEHAINSNSDFENWLKNSKDESYKIKNFDLGYNIGYGYDKNQLKEMGIDNFIKKAQPKVSQHVTIIIERDAKGYKIITAFPSMK